MHRIIIPAIVLLSVSVVSWKIIPEEYENDFLGKELGQMDANYDIENNEIAEDDVWLENENKARLLAYNQDYNDEEVKFPVVRNTVNCPNEDIEELTRIFQEVKKCQEVKHGPFPIMSEEGYIVVPQQYHNISCKEAGTFHHKMGHHQKGALCLFCHARTCEPTIKEISVFKHIGSCWHRSSIKVEAGCKCY